MENALIRSRSLAFVNKKYGFEILIGDQSDPAFWDKQLKKISAIDVLVDDGGHSNLQQIITTEKAIEKMIDISKTPTIFNKFNFGKHKDKTV